MNYKNAIFIGNVIADQGDELFYGQTGMVKRVTYPNVSTISFCPHGDTTWFFVTEDELLFV